MGITARGGWEAVKRHFRELDLDIQSQPFTVVGVGDMSGDVFGNGMLLSPEIRLLAAFDHRDIFIDPAPDAAKALKERQRLFEKPRSSWQDYDQALISKGGGVFSRSLKKIPLNDEMRALLDLEGEDATPQVVMSAILKARVDLLWFGGIGTYIRATSETDLDAGDRANDAIRITGLDLRARVIGEGANLGMTQRGRIEAARHGVHLNTDAIDNSAGVNSSDVEVNLKIALATPESAGQLTRADRNDLLVSMTEDVAGIVLRNNYLQSLALSLVVRKGVHASADLVALMHALEAEGRLDRKVELLPPDHDIEARRTRGEGFTRPEIAVLLAYAKLALHDELLSSDVPDDTYLNAELVRYFPPAMRDRFPDAIESHRLRREIVATQLANAVINRGGPGIVVKLAARTGRSPADIARAYALSRDVLGVLATNLAIDAMDNRLPGAVQLELYASAEVQVVDGMLWFLANVDFSAGLGALVQRFSSAIREVSGAEDALSDSARTALASRRAALAGKGVPEALARRIAAMPFLIGALDASLIAKTAGVETTTAAVTLDALHALLGIGPLLRAGVALEPVDPYERLALDRALSAIHASLRTMAAQVLTRHGPGDAGVAAYVGTSDKALRALRREVETLSNAPLTQARLSVLASQLGEVVG
jgi:glutamate dehydrogenase